MNEQEREKICNKVNAYACLKSGCEYAEAADSQFICNKPKKCGICGQEKPVFAYQECDWEEAKGKIPKKDLLIEHTSKPLRDDDCIGIPICEECYRGEE